MGYGHFMRSTLTGSPSPVPAIHLAILAGIAAAILAPSWLAGPGPSASGVYNFSWTRQVAAAFARGEIYPRWLPGSFEGLGSPTFFFYPPAVPFFTGALAALGLTTGAAINASAFVLLICSGAAMYAWLAWRGTRPLLGAALYMLAPYHLMVFYIGGDMAEFGAFVWLPLIALGIEALPKRWALPLLALSVAGLVLTHLPSALLALTFVAAPLAIGRVYQDRSVLWPGIGAACLGFCLTALYLLPALTLQRHIHTDLLWSEYYQPAHWFFWRRHGDPDFFSFLPLVVLAGVAVSLRARSIWTGIVIVAGLAACGFLPIWSVPPFAQVQFPWRLMSIVEFAAVTALVRAPPRPVVAILALTLCLPSLAATGLSIMAWPQHRDPSFDQRVAAGTDAPEYLPRGFDVAAVTGKQRFPKLAPYRGLPRASASITVSRPGVVTIRRAAFPIWRVSRNNVTVPARGPLITFDASSGTYRLERIRLWQEWLGAIISALAVVVVVLCVLGGALHRRGEAER